MDRLSLSHILPTHSEVSHLQKIDARRYHALIELVDTEQGYVQDLDILVNNYLANLSSLVIPQRTRSSSSFRFSNPEATFSKFTSNHAATSPPTPTPSHLQMHEFFAAKDTSTEQRLEQLALQMPAHPSSGINMISSKTQMPSMLPLLTEDESCILARNASALLKLHTTFAQTLSKCLRSFGIELESNNYRMSPQTDFIDMAVGAVCERFIERAPHFDIYEVFCSGHGDALELMRRAQSAHPVVWDAWEHRCAARTADNQFNQLSHKKAAPGSQQSDHRKSDSRVSDQKNNDLSNVDEDVIRQVTEKIPQPDSSSKLSEHRDISGLSDIATDKGNGLGNDDIFHSTLAAFDASPQSSYPSRHSLHLDSDNIHSKLDSNTSEAESGPTFLYSRPDSTLLNSRKLSLADYLIKPIQRICRYPLLLDQLRRAPNERPTATATSAISCNNNVSFTADGENLGTDDLVERAIASMRRAAQAVDEARRRRDSLARSRIAAARLQAHPRCPFSTPFLEELGACTLVGGLDVVYIDGAEALRQTALHNIARKDNKDNDGAQSDLISDPYMHSQSVQYSRTRKSLRAKYLGAFLYNGGYLILAKPIKAGVYEAKHWFQLAGFDIVEVDDMDGTALLPHSFRLLRPSHRFDLSASCAREKALWQAALREARSVPPAWQHKPVSSIFLHEEPVFEHDDASESLRILQSKIKPSLPAKADKTSRPLVPLSPIAASGTTSSTSNIRPPSKPATNIMSLFTAGSLSTISLVSDDSTPAVRQTSVTRRAQIDRLLLDVFSESCLISRAVAVKDGKLSTGIPSIMTSSHGATSDTEAVSKPALDLSVFDPSSIRASSSPSPPSPDSHRDYAATKGDSEILESPHSSVILADDSASTLILEKFPSHERDTNGHSMSDLVFFDERPRRSYSLADNVKGFFVPRPSSRSSTTPTDEESPMPGGQHLVSRLWRSASLRNRTNSAPAIVAIPQDVPMQPTAIVIDGMPMEDRRGVLSRSPTSSSMPVFDQNALPIEAEDAIYMSTVRSSLDERSLTNENKVRAEQLQQRHNSSTIRRLFRPRQSVINSLTPMSSVR